MQEFQGLGTFRRADHTVCKQMETDSAEKVALSYLPVLCEKEKKNWRKVPGLFFTGMEDTLTFNLSSHSLNMKDFWIL